MNIVLKKHFINQAKITIRAESDKYYVRVDYYTNMGKVTEACAELEEFDNLKDAELRFEKYVDFHKNV